MSSSRPTVNVCTVWPPAQPQVTTDANDLGTIQVDFKLRGWSMLVMGVLCDRKLFLRFGALSCSIYLSVWCRALTSHQRSGMSSQRDEVIAMLDWHHAVRRQRLHVCKTGHGFEEAGKQSKGDLISAGCILIWGRGALSQIRCTIGRNDTEEPQKRTR